MANDDPFSGLHLSEQTPSSKIEQRLFASETPPSPPPQKPASQLEVEPPKAIRQVKPPTTEPEKTPQAAQDQTPAMASSPTKKLSASPLPRFDLNDEPLHKASYLFTDHELEELEDLKLELHREYDQKVTKNDLIRSALHMLLEDHKASGTRSYATRKIRKG